MRCVRALHATLVAVALALALTSSPVLAQDELYQEEDEGPRVEEMRVRTDVFVQDGHGYQSPWGPIRGPGSERAVIVEPQASLRIRQNDALAHDLYVALDVISAASPDGVDLITESSRVNESGTIEVTSHYLTDGSDYFARYGGHMEEHFRSAVAGAGWVGSFAEDNTTFAANGNLVFDSFDPRDIKGRDSGTATRGAINVNVAWSQVLSRTTLVDASYGFTMQSGTLETTWQSVPAHRPSKGPGEYPFVRIGENFPEGRHRHAVAAGLAQHIPTTRSTVKGRYRFYADAFGLFGHTVELALYQYLASFLYVRGSYRLHDQTGVDFYMELAPADFPAKASRTADSDLAPFLAREVGAQVVLDRTHAPQWLRDHDAVDLSYFYYFRDNGLDVHSLSLGYAHSF